MLKLHIKLKMISMNHLADLKLYNKNALKLSRYNRKQICNHDKNDTWCENAEAPY